MKKELLATALVLALGLPQAEATLVDVDWTSGTNGTLGGTAVTLTGVTNPTISTFPLNGAPYSAAPLAPPWEIIQYAVGDDWTASFASPIQDPLLYLVAWRGSAGGPNPVEYAFNHPFTILSGVADGTVNGNTLSVPGSDFHSGILQFTGAVTTLSVSSNSTVTNALQHLTFAYDFTPQSTLIPEPASLSLLGIGLAGLIFNRRRQSKE